MSGDRAWTCERTLFVFREDWSLGAMCFVGACVIFEFCCCASSGHLPNAYPFSKLVAQEDGTGGSIRNSLLCDIVAPTVG